MKLVQEDIQSTFSKIPFFLGFCHMQPIQTGPVGGLSHL